MDSCASMVELAVEEPRLQSLMVLPLRLSDRSGARGLGSLTDPDRRMQMCWSLWAEFPGVSVSFMKRVQSTLRNSRVDFRVNPAPCKAESVVPEIRTLIAKLIT